MGGGQGAARRARAPARTRPRSATRCAAAARSRTSRRAPATRARASTRSPQFVGGGKVLGPQPRDYVVHGAEEGASGPRCASALSLRAQEKKLVIVDAFSFDAPKTKTLAGILKTLGAEQGASSSTRKANVNLSKSARNLPAPKFLAARGPQRLRHPPPPEPRDRRRRRQGDRGARPGDAGRARRPRKERHAFTRTDHQASAAHREGRRASRRPAAAATASSIPRTLKSQLSVRGRARREQGRDPRTRSRSCSTSTSSPSARSVVRGKEKRMGRFVGKRPNWKKAIVTSRPARQHRVLRGSVSAMGLRPHKPTSPGRRGRVAPDFSELSQGNAPEKSLTRAR